MSQISVRTSGNTYTNITQYTIECPFCHSIIVPKYLYLESFRLFACCPNNTCNSHFVLGQNNKGEYVRIIPNSIPVKKEFSEILLFFCVKICVKAYYISPPIGGIEIYSFLRKILKLF